MNQTKLTGNNLDKITKAIEDGTFPTLLQDESMLESVDQLLRVAAEIEDIIYFLNNKGE